MSSNFPLQPRLNLKQHSNLNLIVRVLHAHLVLVDNDTINRPLRSINLAVVYQLFRRMNASLRERNLPRPTVNARRNGISNWARG